MKKLVLGFTGSQSGMTEYQKKQLIHHLQKWALKYEELEIHHGDCVGADYEFHEICKKVWPNATLTIIIHPPTNSTKRAFCEFPGQTLLPPLPYLTRNREIVNAVNGMLAGPKETEEQLRSGTWATIRYAVKTETPLIILRPKV